MVHKVQKARLPAHELVSKRMNDLTRKSQRVTQRALDLLEWVAEVKIPKEHVGVVAASMQAMIDRLGGTHSRRFKNRYRQIAIDHARESLEQQAQASATVTDQGRVSNATSFAA